MAAVLNEVIAQAAALITWRSGPSKWQPREAGCLSPPVGAQYPLISPGHLEPSGHPCLGMALASVLLGEGSCLGQGSTFSCLSGQE